MRKHILFILLALVLTALKSKGQDSLTISPYSLYLQNDTISAGATDSMSFFVVNTASIPFSDTMSVYLSVLDSAGFILHPIDSLTLGAVLLPGDSIQVGFNPACIVSPVKFHYDINVIVIWPLTAASVNVDSLIFTICVKLPDGIDEISTSALISVFPNPVVNDLHLNYGNGKLIEEVRIYDARGRLIQTEIKPDFICTEAWSKGTYLLKVTLSDKRTQIIRVVKQ